MEPLSKEARKIKFGLYRHYKGNVYAVVGVGRHSETLEEMVVYQAEYGDNEIWVRPLIMFIGKVDHEGKEVPRFKSLEK